MNDEKSQTIRQVQASDDWQENQTGFSAGME